MPINQGRPGSRTRCGDEAKAEPEPAMTLLQRMRHLDVEITAAGLGLIRGVITWGEWYERTDVLLDRLARLQLP
jgi:hypothetical protein